MRWVSRTDYVGFITTELELKEITLRVIQMPIKELQQSSDNQHKQGEK